MNQKTQLWASFRITLVCVCLIFSASSRAATLAEAIEAARAHIRQEIAPKTPGLSVAVGRNGKILWTEGFGFADLSAHKPVTPSTLFRVGSVSKPLTATGLMLLVEQRKIDLDADIHQYVADFPDKGAPITTRQLAGHLAGIRHYRGREFYIARHFDSVRASLKIFENDPLLSKPGEQYSYSSYGFNLISMVMESASHQTFTNYMEKAVFLPLHMTNTIPDDVYRTLPARTLFYQHGTNGSEFTPGPRVDNSYKWASGGFLSTPEDLVRFGMAHLHPGLLKKDSLEALFTSQKTTAGKVTGYGIGWGILRDAHGHPVWSHSGGAVGGTTFLAIHPDSGLVIALASNCSNNPWDKKGLQLLTDDFSNLSPTD